MRAEARALDQEIESDPWSFELRNGVICKAEVLPPDWKRGVGWSLAKFYSQEEADADPDLSTRLGDVLAARRIKRAYAPSVATHSARIADREELTTKIVLPGGAMVLRNKDLPADGVPIRRGEAFIMSGAGCPPFILEGKGFTLPVHGSRDTLIDRDHLDGKPARAHPSVIHAAVEYLQQKHGVPCSRMVLKGGLYIPPWEFLHPLDDPDWGERNQTLYEHLLFTYGPGILDEATGEFDLEQLGLAICAKLGVKASFAPPLPKRASTTRDEQKGALRNLVLVYRVQ